MNTSNHAPVQDGATWTAASDVDIDHVVPLKEAWISGAKDWTDARREQFANEYEIHCPTKSYM